MPERRRAATTAERLGRMLVIVPYLVRHPGTTLAEASSLFGVDPAQLRKDLDLLFMSGLPPYGPGDLIDVDVDEDGAITITMADHFARPLRLTRQEALAVHLRATELLATPGLPEAPALASALQRLSSSLGETSGIEAAGTDPPPTVLDDLREAVASRRRIRIDYAAASSGERAWRTIEPEALFASAGHWYTPAWDVDVDAERVFRADRIAAIEGTDATFAPRGLEGAGRPLYTPSDTDVAVRLALAPASRWVAEYYVTTDVVERDDGSVEATLPSRELGWVARLLLRLGPDAEVLEPASLRDQVSVLARRTLAVYGH
jgi:proteasome accessory factor C